MRKLENSKKLDLVDRFRSGVLNTIKTAKVRHGAVCISTPFIGFAGEMLRIYATEDGQISDGGGTLNMFQSLRCYQDYLNWPFREDFLASYCIKEENGRLVCSDLTPSGILRYAQGLARLENSFEAHPLGEE